MREALRGTGLWHVGEDAAADHKGTAGNKAKDKGGATSFAGVEGGGMIALAGSSRTSHATE